MSSGSGQDQRKVLQNDIIMTVIKWLLRQYCAINRRYRNKITKCFFIHKLYCTMLSSESILVKLVNHILVMSCRLQCAVAHIRDKADADIWDFYRKLKVLILARSLFGLIRASRQEFYPHQPPLSSVLVKIERKLFLMTMNKWCR